MAKKTVLASWPKKAHIYEVGPRDGLQSESKVWDVSAKAKLIQYLIAAGLEDIEIGSFVRADRIPQLADTDQVLKEVRSSAIAKKSKANLWAFVGNEKGLDLAHEAGVDGVSFFIATSDTFSVKNVNRHTHELLEVLPGWVKKAKKYKLKTRMYLSTVVYCPYQGRIRPEVVLELVQEISKWKAGEIVLSDTTGDANPALLRAVFKLIFKKHSPDDFALHLHDTRGLALANVMEGLNHGITRFDSSVGGMGGCPYAPGASGNLATEDLANMLSGMGLEKKVDIGLLSKAGFFAEEVLQKKLPSNVLRTLERKITHER